MDNPRKTGAYVSLPADDLSLLNDLAARTMRTRSDLILEALRAHYPTLARAHQMRVSGPEQLQAPEGSASGGNVA